MRALTKALALIAIFASSFPVSASAERFVVTKGTEHKIWTSPGGDRMCYEIVSLATGLPATGRFRRTRAGGQKNLGSHTGSVCFTAKFPVYVLYVAADVEDIVVIERITKNPGPMPRDHDWNLRGIAR